MNSSVAAIDKPAAHRYFSTACFNAVWSLIDKPDRSLDDDESMISLAHAAIWHWTQREDCSPRNLSIGYWQLSRVYALIGQGERARYYGDRCLAVSRDEEPFYLGYAHEALARAAAVLQDGDEMAEHLRQARDLAEAVSDVEEKKILMADLETVAEGNLS